MFTINHIVCTNLLGKVSRSYPVNGGNPRGDEFPEVSQGLILQVDLFKDSNLGLLC